MAQFAWSITVVSTEIKRKKMESSSYIAVNRAFNVYYPLDHGYTLESNIYCRRQWKRLSRAAEEGRSGRKGHLGIVSCKSPRQLTAAVRCSGPPHHRRPEDDINDGLRRYHAKKEKAEKRRR